MHSMFCKAPLISKTGRKVVSMRHMLMRRVTVLVLGLLAGSLASGWATTCVESNLPTLLKKSKAIFVGTVVEGDEHSLRCRLRVMEPFKGVRGDYVDLSPYPGPSVHFKLGEQYLVFASSCPYQDAGKKCLTAGGYCSSTRPLEYARALVEQLRAEKSGIGMAPVYGTLVRTLESDMGIWEEGYERPLPHVVVRLKSDKKSFETRTDEYGVYCFRRLPPGKYQVAADLPSNMALGETIGNGPIPPVELPRRASFMIDLFALPTGRITGRVIGPDGKPLIRADVELYRASRYKERELGLLSHQGDWSPSGKWEHFEFYHLPADDYVLVFNSLNQEHPDAPFPRTFYPDAPDLKSSQIIHLAEGQQILDADIHVSSLTGARPITLRIAWNVKRPQDFDAPNVIVEASKGMIPWAYPQGEDTYLLHLFPDARYTIHAEASCRSAAGIAKSGSVTLDGSNTSVSEVTLTFDEGECRRTGPKPQKPPDSPRPKSGPDLALSKSRS